MHHLMSFVPAPFAFTRISMHSNDRICFKCSTFAERLVSAKLSVAGPIAEKQDRLPAAGSRHCYLISGYPAPNI